MSNTTTITDRRLLAALDYIDQKYIDDVFSIIKEPEADTAVPVKSWRTPLKHSKLYIALAASLLLLSMASPLVNFITYMVSNFTAGAGSESASEAVESTNGMYDEYILTEEDLAELNEAYFQETFVKAPDYAGQDEAFFQKLREEDSKYIKFALSIEHAMERSTTPGRNFYFGKYSDCIVVAINTGKHSPGPYWYRKYVLGEYTFTYSHATMLVCYNSMFYNPEDAYEMGLLSDTDVEKMYEVYFEYYRGGNSNETSN